MLAMAHFGLFGKARVMKVEVCGTEKGFDTPIKPYLWVVKVYGILSPILLGRLITGL